MSHPHQDWLRVPSDKDVLDQISWDQQTCLSPDGSFVLGGNFSLALIWFSLGYPNAVLLVGKVRWEL